MAGGVFDGKQEIWITEEKGRWPSRKKMDAVMRLLKGEDMDPLSRGLRVNAATLSMWREVFLANGLAGLMSREVNAQMHTGTWRVLRRRLS